jgi:transcriptional regulator GlxA family with amidase domain
MHARLTPAWRVSEMAAYCGMSERLFRNVFRDVTGHAPKPFYDRLRLQHAAQFLSLGVYNIKEVAAKTGFSNEFHFSKAFKKHFGHAPSKQN